MSSSTVDLLPLLTRQGVLVTLSIGYWRARKRLVPEDLGLDGAKVDPNLLHLGTKRLLLPKVFTPITHIEARARYELDRHSFAFLDGLARYVPNASLPELTEWFDKLQRRWDAAVEQFLAEYEQHRAEAMDVWTAHAAHLNGNAERFLAALRDAFPDRDELRRKFRFAITYLEERAPQDVELAIATEAQREARARAVREAEFQLCEQTDRFVRDAIATLREETASLVGEMLTTLAQGGQVNQRTLDRLRAFIERFRTLNFAGDGELETLLNHARDELLIHPASTYRDHDAFRDRLTAGLQELRESAQRLAKADTSAIVQQFGALGRRKLTL